MKKTVTIKLIYEVEADPKDMNEVESFLLESVSNARGIKGVTHWQYKNARWEYLKIKIDKNKD